MTKSAELSGHPHVHKTLATPFHSSSHGQTALQREGLAFALGTAVEKSGLAGAIAETLTLAAGGSPILSLIGIYGGTLLLTELISHSAAISLLFPIALNTADGLGIDYMPFVAAVTVAGSLGFATPLGYQIHMMVYGPGG